MASNDGKKVMRELVRELERQGFACRRGGKHIRVYNAEGKPVYTMPVTPGEGRAVQNMIAGLRRAGFVWRGR